jgi:hypothetical protein
MIKIALKHYLVDIGLSVFFDNVSKSFTRLKQYKFSRNPERLKELYPIGSIIYADFELSIWGVIPDYHAKLEFTNHPCRITGYNESYNGLYCYASGIYTDERVFLFFNDNTNRWCSHIGMPIDKSELTDYVKDLAYKNQMPINYD